MDPNEPYLHWTREALINSLIQAEGALRTLINDQIQADVDIKELREKVAEFRDEAERYHQESRDSARVIGGILRVLHDAPADPEQKPTHGKMPDGDFALSPRCFCGAQWLEQSNRCVTHDPKMLGALNIRAERGFE